MKLKRWKTITTSLLLALSSGEVLRAQNTGLEAPPAEAVRTVPLVDEEPAPVPGGVLSERVVRYAIEVRLDPVQKTLQGKETITWTNRSPEPVSEVQLHLYWNAFKNQDSTFMREKDARGFRFQTDAYASEDWGYIDLKSFMSNGRELIGGLEFIQPDDANAHDQTVARLTLDQPVPPGGIATYQATFESKVPRVIARTGFYQDFFLIGQWFPKLGVLEYPGIRGATATAWNCHQFHADSEFYADFGTFDVQITVPKTFKVGAVGQRVETRPNPDGTATYRYRQDDVHDFAWTAWPEFLEVDEVFEEPGFPKVNLHLLIPPERVDSVGPVFQAAKEGLRIYGEAWFPYPYPQLTIVVPPYNAEEAGGMEYPTFITTWADIHPSARFFEQRITTLHEFGHQYWYGMIASNEFEESWMDEGINTYGTALAMSKLGIGVVPEPKPVLGLPIPLGGPEIPVRAGLRAATLMPWWSPIQTAAWEFLNRGDYRGNSYARAAVTLQTLEGQLGTDTMAAVMRTYARRWAFRHPRSEDFYAVAEEVSGQDLDWFFDQFFRGTEALDYAVTGIDVDERTPGQGYFDRDGERVLVDEKTAREARKAHETAKDEKVYRSEVVVKRLEGAWFPVEVRVTFDDGSEVLEHWDGRARWKRFVYERPVQVMSAVVDPEHKLWMDRNWLNNGRTREPDRLPAARLNGLLLNLEQLALSLLSMLL